MIISHSNKFIFIKSRKTAGTSVEAALSNTCRGDDIVTPLGNYTVNRDETGKTVHRAMNTGDFLQHDDCITIRSRLPREVWDGYFKFSITRNPWDRVLSLFFWRHRNDEALRPRRRLLHLLGGATDEFDVARKLFSRYVRDESWETNDGFYLIDGKLCVDYVVRYESLQDNLNEVCRRLAVPSLELPHLKSGMRDQDNHYSRYYDAESRAIVEQRHRNDIQLFGYAFESA